MGLNVAFEEILQIEAKLRGKRKTSKETFKSVKNK
jgi:hypothetical protein